MELHIITSDFDKMFCANTVRDWQVCAPYQASWFVNNNGDLFVVENDTKKTYKMSTGLELQVLCPIPKNNLLIVGSVSGVLGFLPVDESLPFVLKGRRVKRSIASHAVIAHSRAVTAIAVPADESYMVSGGADGKVVKCPLDASKLSAIEVIAKMPSPIISIACALGCVFILTRDGSYMYDRELKRIGDGGNGTMRVTESRLLIGITSGLTVCAFTGDVLQTYPAIERTLNTFAIIGDVVYACYSDARIEAIDLNRRASTLMGIIDSDTSNICAFPRL